MATLLEPSCSQGSAESLENELIRMYKDTEQFSTVMLKWIDATSALYELKDQPAYTTAHVRWEQACLVMDKTKGNCAALCQMLDGLTTSMRQCQQPKTASGGKWM